MKNDVMLRDIESQGAVLAEGLTSMRAQVATSAFEPRPTRIVLTGSGDSYIAAVAVEALYRSQSWIPVDAVPSLDASRYVPMSPGTLVVVTSVSGEVARTLEVAARAAAAGATTVAITCDGNSTLARSADASIVMPPPIDRSIPHSRDYTLSLLALACLLERLAGSRLAELDSISVGMTELIARSFRTLATMPVASGTTWFLGAGPDRATAMFGALKYWEAAGLEAWWDDLEEFAHGSQLMARPGDRAVLVASEDGCQRAIEMTAGLERMGLDVVMVGGSSMQMQGRPHLMTTDELPARWHPFVSCVPLQVMTLFEAEARSLDVSVLLDGQPHGPTFDEVHVEWTKHSAVVLDDGSVA